MIDDNDPRQGWDDQGEVELRALWEPLFSILTPAQRREAERIERIERDGMFAWGVRSGHFLWVRTNPGEIPTWRLLRQWAQAGAA